MSLYHLLILALIQGLTEFLPVSSSAHLILFPALTGTTDQGLAVDVAVHVGTLGAVILYFRRDVARAFRGFLAVLRGRLHGADSRLFLLLVAATVPVVVLGLLFKLTGLEERMRSVTVIGWAMVVFGLLLWWVDRRFPERRRAEGWNLRDAVVMGLWQAVALIPGTSRSGITITAGRMLGYAREDAARLAMLMSIPTILASGTLLGLDVVRSDNPLLWRETAIAAMLAFLAGFLALSLMMRLLRLVSFTPYILYRLALGVALLWIAYG